MAWRIQLVAAGALTPVAALGLPEQTVPLAIAGLVGAMVRTLNAREGWAAAARSAAVGAGSAIYLGPAVVPIIEAQIGVPLEMTELAAVGFAGFMVGATGTLLIGFFSDLIRFFRSNRGGQ